MKFNGEFKNGRFVPEPHYISLFRLFKDKCEADKQKITIEITNVQSISDKQAGLFKAVLIEVSRDSGSTFEEVFRGLNHLRLMEHTPTGQIMRDLSTYNTQEFSLFIDQSLAYLNELFNLDIQIIKDNGKAKINVTKKS